MIWSVSTLLRRSGSAVPVWVVNVSMSAPPHGSRVADQPAGGPAGLEVGRGAGGRHRGGRGDERGDQVRAAALALAALEVAVRGGRGALAGGELVRVHAEAHRAAGATPLGAGRVEHLVQALGLGLQPDPGGARHDQHASPSRRPGGPRAPRRRRAGPRSGRWCRSRGTPCPPRSRASGVPAVRPMYSSALLAATPVAGRRGSTPGPARTRRAARPGPGWCPR